MIEEVILFDLWNKKSDTLGVIDAGLNSRSSTSYSSTRLYIETIPKFFPVNRL